MATLEILSPGVYGFERAPARAPEGVSPAKAAFVGWTDEGPENTPVEVRSTEEFTTIFGPITALGIVPMEVRAFFATGGERAYIVRVVAADAVKAEVEVDPVPGPTKWTFRSKGSGVYGNDTTVRIQGNQNWLDRTPGAPAWEKFDLKVIRPSDFDPTILEAKETYEAIQFSDPDASDYVMNVFSDPRVQSLLIEVIEGAGGTPTGLLGATVADENIGTGTGVLTNFTGTLAQQRVLDGSVRIVAGGTQVNDQAQTPSPAINGVATTFTLTLPTAPVLDGSVRFFFAKITDVIAESPAVTGLVNGVNKDFQIAALALANAVYREATVFRIRYAATAPSSPELLFTVGGVAATHDLSTTPLSDTPVHPGTVSIAVDMDGSGPQVITDDAAGNLTGTGGVLPLGGTINYATGAMTGVTANLTALSTVIATYSISNVITKPASGDNMAQAVQLAGSVDPAGYAGGGAAANYINLVNSVTAPTGAGLIQFRTLVAPLSGTTIYVDYVRLGIINSSLAGVLSGDVTGIANTVNFTTGIATFTTNVAPRTATTIDADYQTGLIVTDNGLGALIGNIDATGNNTIDYDTGAFDVTFSSAPLAGTAILANYDVLDSFVDYPLTGGANGSAIGRNDISAIALEPSKAGIYALDKVEEPLNVVVPDFEGSEFVQFDLVQFCKNRPNARYAVMCFANGTTKDEAIQYVLVTQSWDEKIGAIYYPNIYFLNDLTQRPELIPVSGFAAGVIAKTANNKNIGKSPGGIEDGALDGEGTVGPEFILDQDARDDLYQSRINPIISSVATGLAVWGVRSLSRDQRWRYINARQLHNYLMYTLNLNLQWAVFENNGPQLWAKIETALKGYMGSLFRLGYFSGETEAEAFFVKCNATNNNATTVSQGKAIIDIGFSPNIPAEFIIFTLQQPVGQQVEV
jgi:hypothetical protein